MAHELRIQRKRTRGWRMPDGAVYVGRPGVFGNPYTGSGGVDAFREMITQMQKAMRGEGGLLPIVGKDYAARSPSVQEHALQIVKRFPELRGKQLACWCSLDKPCHADVLAELANA